MKMITTYHPMDPDTEERFSMDSNVTVYRYGWKIIDCCYCFACYKCCKWSIRKCIRCYSCRSKEDEEK